MKQTAIFIVSLFLLFTLKAQQVHFGLKGGVNVSQLHYGNNTSANSKAGLHLGVLAHIHASKTWAIQPELLYSLEGAQKVRFPDFSAIPEPSPPVKYNLNYLNVPVLLQYMFDNGFRLEGGPQIGFLLSAKRKSGDVTIDYEEFKSTAVSIPLGVGYLSSSGFGIDARYVFGLSNLNDSENGTVIQSNVFQLGLFYQLSDPKILSHHK